MRTTVVADVTYLLHDISELDNLYALHSSCPAAVGPVTLSRAFDSGWPQKRHIVQ